MTRRGIDTSGGMVLDPEDMVEKIENYLKTIDEVIQKTVEFLDNDEVRHEPSASLFGYVAYFKDHCAEIVEVLNKAKDYYQGLWEKWRDSQCIYGPPEMLEERYKRQNIQ